MLRMDADSLTRRFRKVLGYEPNLQDPKTLQEKILWRKLHEDMSDAVRLADKVAVRDYVREVAGERYLVPAAAVVDDAHALDFESLPAAFVLKVNHSSGAVIVVRDGSKLDLAATRRTLNGLLRSRWGRRMGEHWYSSIPPRVIVERLLVDGEPDMPPCDYRFHVFHGRTEFIEVVTGKTFSIDLTGGVIAAAAGQSFVDSSRAEHTTYDRSWRPAPYRFLAASTAPDGTPRPQALDELLAVAERLAGDWGYVRVDLYCLGGDEIYFGEMTFAHGSGLFLMEPPEANEHLGSLWDIGTRYVREPGRT